MTNIDRILRVPALVLLAALVFSSAGMVQALDMPHNGFFSALSMEKSSEHTSASYLDSAASRYGAIHTFEDNFATTGISVTRYKGASRSLDDRSTLMENQYARSIRFSANIPLSWSGNTNISPLLENMRKKITERPALGNFSGSSGMSLVSTTGEIRFMDFEGGFFGIVGDDGTHYLPSGLPEKYMVDGLKVSFSGIAHAPEANIRMWGMPLDIRSIRTTGEEFDATGTVTYFDLEGGFYGIVGSDQTHYLPLNLPPEFEKDGIKVSFTAVKETEVMTIQMWGTPIRILSIRTADTGTTGDTQDFIGNWQLEERASGQDMVQSIPGTRITASFTADGGISGSSGCNLYGGSWMANGESFAIGQVFCTEMYCMEPEGVMDQESAYLTLLGQVAGYTMTGERLVLTDNTGTPLLVFSAAVPDSADEDIPVIEFSRTGGFAGFDDHIAIYADGSAVVTRKETTARISLPEGTLQQLSTLFDQASFDELEDLYPAPTPGCDYFSYIIVYNGKSVTTEDTGVPTVLEPIIRILGEIIGGSAPDDVIPPAP
jgi:heat shock protein HslJ